MTGHDQPEPNLHRDNAAEIAMRVLIAPFVLIARAWVWLTGTSTK